MQKKIIAVLAFIISLTLISSAFASSVIPVDLKQMTTKAGNIFYGVCKDVQVAEDENGFMATTVSYDVIRSVKGGGPKTIKFKVFGVAADIATEQPTTLIGMPRFYLGREDVLFLYKASGGGYTSPIGLWQGAFPVVRKDGESKLVDSSDSYKQTLSLGTKTVGRGADIITPDDLLDQAEEILEEESEELGGRSEA